jgi:hypothetical protein
VGLVNGSRLLTQAEENELRAALERAVCSPVRYLHPDGRVRRRLPLPWRTRARLGMVQAANRTGIWLCEHGHEGTALRFWQALGMVSSG